MLYARFSHLYFCQRLDTLQRGLSVIAELLVNIRDGFYGSNDPTNSVKALTEGSVLD